MGTRNFEALKIGASSRRFNILCRNDESRDLPEMSFNFCQRMVSCYLNIFIKFQRLENSVRLILHQKLRNLRNLALLLISSADH